MRGNSYSLNCALAARIYNWPSKAPSSRGSLTVWNIHFVFFFCFVLFFNLPFLVFCPCEPTLWLPKVTDCILTQYCSGRKKFRCLFLRGRANPRDRLFKSVNFCLANLLRCQVLHEVYFWQSWADTSSRALSLPRCSHSVKFINSICLDIADGSFPSTFATFFYFTVQNNSDIALCGVCYTLPCF